jgi:GH24 family phage-related lysozyme (muramidase)
MLSDQVLVRFGGDTGQFKSQMDGAANTVRGTTQSIRDSLSGINASMAQLQAQMSRLSDVSAQTAGSTRTLESYANWAFALQVLKFGYEGTRAAASGFTGTVGQIPSILQKAEQSAQSAALSYREYIKSLGYSKEWGPLVRVENEGIAASIGRMIERVDTWIRSAEIYKSGVLEAAGATIAAAGAMDRFQQVAQEKGFENATRALQHYVTELSKIPDASQKSGTITNEMAATIAAGFGSIKNISAPLMDALVQMTVQMSSSREQAEQWSQKFQAAFRDPSTGGMSLLNSLGAVNETLKQQFQLAQRNNDAQGMQATLVRGVIAQQKLLFDERLRKLSEEAQAYSRLGPIGQLLSVAIRAQIEEAKKASAEFDKQAEALEKSALAIRRMLPDAEQLRSSMNGVASSLNPLVTQLDQINSRISILQQGLQGSTGDAAALLRNFEGFRSSAYWDVNAWRVGYGSDTKTNADGSVEKVTRDTVVTREDAERDLARRIVEFQEKAAEAIGPAWTSLSDKARASITSVTYNYGSTPGSVIRAAKTGDDSQIADAIRSLSANPGRRSQEAANITSSTLSGASSKEIEAATQAKAKLLDQERQLKESVSGGNALEKARAENIREEVAGRKDDVAAQQRVVEATRQELAQTNDAQSKQKLAQDVQREELVLLQKKNELKKSELNLEIASTENPEQKLAAQKKLYDFEQSLVARNSAQWNVIEAQKVAAQAAYDKSISENDKLAAEERRNIALRELEERRTILREQVAEGQISHQQLLQADIILENQRTAIERDHWTKLKEIATEGTAEHRQIVSKMSQLDAEASARRQKTISRDTQMIVRDYKQAFDQIGSTISSSLMGMIQGTEKFSGLIKNVALKIVQYFIDAGIKMVTTWAANIAAKTATTVAGEAAETAATAAGTSARTGMEGAAAAATVATKIPAMIKSIVSSAAETFAGVFAWLSPIMGPAAAGPAVAAMSTVMGATSMVAADIGMWSVPKDRVQLVHENEHIMPARESEAFRKMLTDYSSGESRRAPVRASAAINISSPDARGVQRLFERNDQALVKTVDKAIRRGIHRTGKY